jgi:hypothetical protein
MNRTTQTMRDILEEEARVTQSAEIGVGTSAADVDMEVVLIEQVQAHLAAHVAL